MKISLKKIIGIAVAALALLVFGLSFAAKYSISGDYITLTAENVIWHPADDKVLALPLVGVILALVGGLVACTFTLFGEKIFKKALFEKIAVCTAGLLLVVGGIFLFTTAGQYEALNPLASNGTCAMSIVLGVVAIFAGLGAAAAEFIPNK